MSDAHFILRYVERPAASAAFYEKLLGRAPIEQSPTFAMFALAEGLMLGLWIRSGVEPAAQTAPGADGELAFVAATPDEVVKRHAEWIGKGVPIAQALTAMDFGFTFVGLDPDGHRLRVFCPG